MKILLCVGLVSILLSLGCTGVKTVSTGQESVTYLEIIGNPSMYPGGVDINIDQKLKFKASVMSPANIQKPGGKIYAISPGAHSVEIRYKNQIIVTKQIFASAQETKRIILP